MEAKWPTPKPSIHKPLTDYKYYAINGLLYMNDGSGEQSLIGSFRRTTMNNEEHEKKLAEFAAHCMNKPNVELSRRPAVGRSA